MRAALREPGSDPAPGSGVDPGSTPGRTCPASYRYSPRVFDRAPEIVAETLYVVGGLYGNLEALNALAELAGRERGPVTMVFNGDFHWFDVEPPDFAAIDAGVLGHAALRGNVETEVAAEESGSGCGCAYPVDVSDAEVSRSNEILARLRTTATRFPQARAALARLPMHLVARVGDARVGLVHGDATSLAGWGFAHDRLDDPGHGRWIASIFRDASMDVFASTHTCLPAFRRFEWQGGAGVVANNGAAGMPNFQAAPHGLVTRISTHPRKGSERVFGLRAAGAHVEALAVRYDTDRWMRRFLESWPEGSAAHASYHRRIAAGPRFTVGQARPRTVRVA
jgi:hypothetical protein